MDMEKKIENICHLSLDIFTIIKQEYSMYLSKEKLDFLNKLKIENFYKIINNPYLPAIYFIGDKYYLNSYYKLENIEKLIPFLCLASVVSNLNPLKLGLIEEELLELKEKYNLNIDIIFAKELDVASLISKSILMNVPFKLIFKESDADIFNYLEEELGSKYALCYYNVSHEMKKIRGNSEIFDFSFDYDYTSVFDYIYDFISNKVR